MKKYQSFAGTTALLTSLLLSGCVASPYSPSVQSANPSRNSERPSPESTAHCGSIGGLQGYFREDCTVIVTGAIGSHVLPGHCYDLSTTPPSTKMECAGLRNGQ